MGALRAIAALGADAFDREILQTCGNQEEANSAEDRWIAQLGTRDPARGFNVMRGGRCAAVLSSDDVRARMSSSAKARWSDPERRAEVLAAQRAPEVSAKRSANAKAQWADPEIAAKNRAAIEAARTPDVHARGGATRAANMTDETREKLRAGQQRRWERPGERERAGEAQRAAKSTPEYRARASSAAKAGVTDATREAHRATALRQWADPAKRAQKLEALAAGRAVAAAKRASHDR